MISTCLSHNTWLWLQSYSMQRTEAALTYWRELNWNAAKEEIKDKRQCFLEKEKWDSTCKGQQHIAHSTLHGTGKQGLIPCHLTSALVRCRSLVTRGALFLKGSLQTQPRENGQPIPCVSEWPAFASGLQQTHYHLLWNPKQWKTLRPLLSVCHFCLVKLVITHNRNVTLFISGLSFHILVATGLHISLGSDSSTFCHMPSPHFVICLSQW